MITTHRNNRLVPAIIITICLWLSYRLIDPRVNNLGSLILPGPLTTTKTPTTTPEQDQNETTTPLAPSSPPATTPTPAPQTTPNTPSDTTTLLPTDILLIMKTGGTSLYKRLLIHLPTSLSPARIPLANIAIYSDTPAQIGPYHIIDVLANTTSSTLSSPDFAIYHQQPAYAAHNAYSEAAGVEGDGYGPPGGWIIDKYKFVPLMQHAGRNWPAAKWYVYMEDDTYLFLPNILRYLSAFDWRDKHYLGSFAAKSDTAFAHGGAGFALSRGAWEASFGKNERLAEEYEAYTADHCCGDQVLGHALAKYGVKFGENGGDGKFTWGFNPGIHWRFGFERWNWCKPLLSWHKVHGYDVARYFELEGGWDYTKPLLHRDFFRALIAPQLQKRMEWWDNMSGVFRVTSGNKADPPTPGSDRGTFDATVWKKGWESADACEAACEGWSACIQWSYVEDLCSMDDKAFMGSGYAPGMPERKTALKTTSGWFTERLDGWTCE